MNFSLDRFQHENINGKTNAKMMQAENVWILQTKGIRDLEL